MLLVPLTDPPACRRRIVAVNPGCNAMQRNAMQRAAVHLFCTTTCAACSAHCTLRIHAARTAQRMARWPEYHLRVRAAVR